MLIVQSRAKAVYVFPQWTVHTDHLFLLGLDQFAYCLLSTYYVSVTMLGTFHALTYVLLPRALLSGVDYAHFTDGKTEAQKSHITCLGSHSQKSEVRLDADPVCALNHCPTRPLSM